MIDEAVRYALRCAAWVRPGVVLQWGESLPAHFAGSPFAARVRAYFRFLAAGNHGGASP